MADPRLRLQMVEDGRALAEGQVPPRVLNSFTPEICLSLGLRALMGIQAWNLTSSFSKCPGMLALGC